MQEAPGVRPDQDGGPSHTCDLGDGWSCWDRGWHGNTPRTGSDCVLPAPGPSQGLGPSGCSGAASAGGQMLRAFWKTLGGWAEGPRR